MESGRLEEEKLLVWNRLPGYNFVLVLFFILIIVIFCHLSLLCLKMAPGGLKLVAANKHLAVKKEFDFRFWKAFYHLKQDLTLYVLMLLSKFTSPATISVDLCTTLNSDYSHLCIYQRARGGHASQIAFIRPKLKIVVYFYPLASK